MNNNQPLVSIIVPAYNHANYIRDCLMSIFRQTYRNLELIIIDDGSRDATAAVIETFLAEYGGRFARVEFRSRPNRGVSATLNELVSLSRGEWIHPLSSDDMYLDNKVEVIWQAYQEWGVPEVALIYGDTLFMDMDGNPIEMPKGVRPSPGPTHQGYLELFFANRLNGPTMAFRRQAIEAIGGFDESLPMEDWDCWLRLSARYPIGRVPEPVSRYRYHADNSHRGQARMLRAMLLTFGKFLARDAELLPATLIRKNWRKNLHRLYRWARREDPGFLPWLLLQALQSPLRLPTPADYTTAAKRIAHRLEGRS